MRIRSWVDSYFLLRYRKMRDERRAHPVRAGEILSIDDTADEQYATSATALARLRLYKYALSHNPEYDDPRYHGLHVTDIHHIQVRHLKAAGMLPTASVLDIGCNDGHTLLNFAMNYEHVGNLTGLNKSRAAYSITGEAIARDWVAKQRETTRPQIPEFKFVEGDARALPPEIKGVDVALLNFILYHLDNPELAINEAIDALNPNGLLSIAVRGTENMQKQWKLIRKIGAYLGAIPPTSFYQAYDIERLDRDMAERGHKVVSEYEQFEEVHIPAEGLQDYIDPILLLKSLFIYKDPDSKGGLNPLKDPMDEAIDEIVVKPALKDIQQKGYFSDTVRQAFRIYRIAPASPSRRLILPRRALTE